ncbi:MAG: SPFH domain-containing protein [Bryobacteraceae bacterium]
MLAMMYVFLVAGAGLFAAAAALLARDLHALSREGEREIRWREAARLSAMGFAALLAGLSINVVPSGMAGVRVSQISGTLPGTLYPGTHFTLPLVQRVAMYDTRDRVFHTAAVEDPKKEADTLKVQTKDGLIVGLAVSVRYRIEPRKLDYVHAHLPQPVEQELVPPVVSSVFREVVPNYLTRELFVSKRDEVRRRVTDGIMRKLAPDAIMVKEVMLRDVLLPAQYAKGLEGLLLKEQENERLAVEVEVKQKLVRTAELEAEADKARQVKQAEGLAQVTILQAKAQADAMQHTLPLKEKQIQQSRLEAQARKEATVQNAEASAQAKVIDGKAELERRKLLNEAEGHRIRMLAGADAERMKLEAAVLKENPLVIQKIVAEKLSDKVQIMMVPSDGKFFFANDVLRGMNTAALQEKQ